MNLSERVQAYIDKVPGAVNGDLGGTKTFCLACALMDRFALNKNQLLQSLRYFNTKCVPEWSERELRHKVEDALKRKHARGVEQSKPEVVSVPTLFLPASLSETLSQTPPVTYETRGIDNQALTTTGTNGTLEIHTSYKNGHFSCKGMDSAAPSVPRREPLGALFFALDIETYPKVRLGKTGKVLPPAEDATLNPETAEIRLVSFCDAAGDIDVCDLLKSPLTPTGLNILGGKFVSHNAEFEARFFKAKFGIVPQQVFCTLLASRLLSPGEPNDFKSVVKRHLGVDLPKDQGTSDWGAEILSEEQLEYARNDVRYLLLLKAELETKLEATGLSKIAELDNQILVVVMAMELHGFPIDRGAMASMKVGLDREAEALLVDIRGAVGNADFNPLSPKHVPEALNVVNNREETLKESADPRAALILRYKKARKLSGRLEGDLKRAGDGRLHSTFEPKAKTGRFTSKWPNLQNVTKGPLRSCFIPSAPDRRLIVADYSQIELRVAALVAGDEAMIAAFRNGEDLHVKIAARNAGKLESEVNEEDRFKGKATNFGFIYGQGPDGFMKYAKKDWDLILSLEDAVRFQDNFFGLYPGVRKWHSECWDKVNAGKNATRTVFGRPLLPDSDDRWKRFCMFTNYVVQGSCADLIKAAMLKTVSVLPKDVRLVATVHDELIFDAPADTAGQHCDAIHKAMVDAFVEMFGETVPVEVEAKVCNHWGDK